MPPPDAVFDKNLDQRPTGRQQTSPTSAGSKAGLQLMPVDSVTLSDGHNPGRTPGDPPLCMAALESPP